MIKYIKGDLLNAPQLILTHQCNAQDTMGSGVAKAIRAKYPKAYNDYLQYFRYCPKELRMGQVCFSHVGTQQDPKIVANLVGQFHYLPRGLCHTDYKALEEGFTTIKLTFPDDVAMPKIGCGLGGGDWKIVSAIIESVFDDRDVYIYEL